MCILTVCRTLIVYYVCICIFTVYCTLTVYYIYVYSQYTVHTQYTIYSQYTMYSLSILYVRILTVYCTFQISNMLQYVQCTGFSVITQCVRHLQLIGNNDEILDIALVGEEEEYIAMATNSSLVKVFNRRSFGCHLLHGHTAVVLCLDCTSDGRVMVTGSKVRVCYLVCGLCCVWSVCGCGGLGVVWVSRGVGEWGCGCG